MTQVSVEALCGPHECRVSLTEFSSEGFDLGEYSSAFIITDANVKKHLGHRFPDLPVVEIEPGEASKDLSRLGPVYEGLLQHGADRKSLLLGVGGGVVTDITGFIGATFKRGVDFGFVPTTLLAQVDAAIGGKNGVNIAGYKNQAGTVVQPRFVNIDITTLDTLTEEEYRNGMAEIIKTAAVGDAELFNLLEAQRERVQVRDPDILEEVVFRCARVKTGIVLEDEFELGVRAVLNFGHTLGHALESVSGLRHGEAVALGMVIESRIAYRLGHTPLDLVDRLTRVIDSYGLLGRMESDIPALLEAIDRDKKRTSDTLRFAIVGPVGESRVAEVDISHFKELLNDLR